MSSLGGEVFRLPGSHRSRAIAETMSFAEQAARKAGVTRVSEITDLDTVGIPTFTTVRPLAAPGTNTVTNGKGLDRASARVSALMEAIERYCGERNGRAGDVRRTSELEDPYVHPHELILSEVATWTPDLPLEWWPARDVCTGDLTLVPAAAVLCPYPVVPSFFLASSNGMASGNDLAEALLHALLEVVERDATAFGEASMDRPLLDLETVPDLACRDLFSKFADRGIEVLVRYFESPMGLPTFQVLMDDTVWRDPLLINSGYGCHLDPMVALRRAITEAAQSRLNVIAGHREDLAEEECKRRIGYDALKSEFGAWFAPSRGAFTWPDLPGDQSTGSISTDIELVIQRLAAAGLRRVLAVELTTEEVVGLSVVRAIVPGAELVLPGERRVGPRLAASLAGTGG